MKRKVFFIGAAVIIALAGVNLNLAMNSEHSSNLTLSNIVSLAKVEDGDKYPIWGKKMDKVMVWTGEYVIIFGIYIKVYAEYDCCVDANENTACNANAQQAGCP